MCVFVKFYLPTYVSSTCCTSQKLAEDLQTETENLESLKFVLGVIAKVREISLDVELRYRDVQERYRTLAMYSIEVGPLTYVCTSL